MMYDNYVHSSTGRTGFPGMCGKHSSPVRQKKAARKADCFLLVTRTGLPACGRAASRGKRATGTFSYTLGSSPAGDEDNQKHRPCLMAEPMFLVTRTGLEPMLPP